MDTRHIKAAKIMSVEEIIEASIFECANDDQWGIEVIVSEEFKVAFIAFMEERLHQMHIYRGISVESAEELGISKHEALMTSLYIDSGRCWSFTDQGNLMMQVTYETEDREIPEQAWVYPVATLKAVLQAM